MTQRPVTLRHRRAQPPAADGVVVNAGDRRLSTQTDTGAERGPPRSRVSRGFICCCDPAEWLCGLRAASALRTGDEAPLRAAGGRAPHGCPGEKASSGSLVACFFQWLRTDPKMCILPLLRWGPEMLQLSFL